MYVDKLELYGFKSFMHRVEIPLARGITAIVGPNGCGKSNTSDALRWVLGEQNARHLRGEKIDDVIFKGSGQHKPLGMAEVSLTLMNDDGMLPVEYSQVQVARRVFRSGESEFLINKVPCRLKDIKDLFLGTGLGSHGYSIIERDMVDQVLSEKDDARRLLFEEASGISRYKQRRREAERKLEGVVQDLIRIEDMIREIEREVRSLARQAGKVRRWKRLKSELDRHEVRFAWERWQRLRADELSIDEAHRLQERDRQDLQSQFAVLDARRETDRQASLDLGDALAEAQRELEAATRALASSQEEIRVLSARNEAWTREAEELRRQSGRHEERLEEARTEQVALAPARDALRGRLADARTRAEESTRQLKAAEQQLRDVRGRLHSAQQTNLDLFSAAGQTRKELETTAARREADAKRLNHARDHLQAFASRVEAVDGLLGESRAAVGRCEQDEAARLADRDRLRGELESLRAAREARHGELTQSARTRASTGSRLELLEEQAKRHAGFDQAVRFLLEHREELDGVVGAVGELVRLRPGVDAVGAAALGEAVPWILVRDEETALALIGRLREQELSGVTFFPLAEAGVLEIEEGPEIEAMLRVVHLFDAEAAARPFVYWLAQRTRLIGGRSDVPGALAPGIRYVTAAGELLEGRGPVRLGGERREETEILRRGQEMPVLREEFAALSVRVAELEAEETSLKEREAELGAALAGAERECARATKERSEALVQHRTHETELAMLREERTRLESEVGSLDVELARLTEDITRLDQDARRRGEDSSSAQTAFEELSALAEREEAARDEAVRVSNARDMEAVRIENELRAAESRVSDLEREQREREEAKAEIEARLTQRGREAEDAEARIGALERDLVGITADRGAREQGVAEHRARHLEAQDRLATADAELKRLRESLDSLTQTLHAADLGRQRTQAEADQIRARVLEEYKIDLESWAGPSAFLVALEDEPEISDEELAEAEAVDSFSSETSAAASEASPASADASSGATSEAAAASASADEAELAREENPGDEKAKRRAERRLDRERKRREEELEAEGALPHDARVERMAELRRKIQEMGSLNFVAEEEYRTHKTRLDFHQGHARDLRTARGELLEVIRQVNEKASEMFAETFRQVQEHFQVTYQQLFPGGEASLRLAGDDPLEGDIEISARPRGKKLESIRLLSTGERSLTAIAMLFAIYLAKPSPICLLDEVDAPLDDANLDRFLAMVRHFSERTQFIMITHNKKTMATAGRLFGVTMEEPGVSKLVSVRLNEAGVELAEGTRAGESFAIPGNGQSRGVPGAEPAGTA